jgi:protein SCO1/2
MRHFSIFALALLLAACSRGEVQPGLTDIAGVMPDLSFHLTRANDGKPVTPDNYRGKVVALYFGYTHCPDECPTTLANFAKVLQDLHGQARNVRVLFVTVDPARDTRPVLKAYVSTFAPEVDGLRGTDDQLATLARRYRVLYRVTPASAGRDMDVMHSDSVFFFDPDGRARTVSTDTGVEAIRKSLVALL